jgi:hypothetical protein
MVTNTLSRKRFIRTFAPSLMRFQDEELFPTLVSVAQKITRKQQLEEIIEILEQRPKIREQFQQQLLCLELQFYQKNVQILEQKQQQYSQKRFYVLGREAVMVVSATLGLMGCLGVLLCFRSSMPAEIVGILSAMIGIFGACMKDLYRQESEKRQKLYMPPYNSDNKDR